MSIIRPSGVFLVPLLALMIGCGEADRNSAAAVAERAPAPVPARAPAEARRTILFLGTSLTAGLGLDPSQAYPEGVQARIDSAGLPFRVVNAGVSGESSAGALRRLDWLLRQPFEVLVLETGANDMLQGTDPASTAANLQAIIDRVRAERPDARIVLAGMRALPNLGPEYVREFEAVYPEIARRNRLPTIPFLLEGVARDPALNLADGVHPNEAGQRRVAENVWRALEPVLREVE